MSKGSRVADIAVSSGGMGQAGLATSRASVVRRFRRGDSLFRVVTLSAALSVLIILCGVLISLVFGAWPALRQFGLGFFIHTTWNPARDDFGALAAIYGTLVTSVLAMLLAVPVSFGIAVFLTELCPWWMRRPIGIAIELLAGIPSIIYGIWGLFVFLPFVQSVLQPWLIDFFAPIPVLNILFAGPPYGIGVLSAAFILAIMVVPFITAVTRDVFETVPSVLKEAAYGIGATRFEVVRRVVIPYTRTGLVGGVMLGLGRALGETMAVTFVIGNAHTISSSLLAPGTTISAVIANEFSEATDPMYVSSLIALGLILFLITFIVLAISRLLLMRIENAEAK